MKKRVFVIACSPRSGSTLLQRLLMSHPDLFMWGETDHIVRHLINTLGVFSNPELGASDRHWQILHKNGSRDGWFPMLLPVRGALPFRDQIAEWINDLLVNPYDPTKSWGFKTVRLEPLYVKTLHAMFPDAGFIFLERPWSQVWQSVLGLEEWFAETKEDRYKQWHDLMAFFQDPGFDALRVSYTQLTRQPEVVIPRIEQHLEMEPGSLNRDVMKHKVRCEQP